MNDKETIEIHKTEYVDKDLPTIYYEHVTQSDMTHGEKITITVSDKTSKAAFRTFKEIRKEIRSNDK